MTESTGNIVSNDAPRLWPFLAALIAAPLITGAPFLLLVYLLSIAAVFPGGLMVILAVPVVGTVLGAPTYLLFGGPAFWVSLGRGFNIPAVAFAVNLASLPVVALAFGLLGGNPIAALTTFGFLGSIFAPLWGAVFSSLYERFSGEESHV